jgi:hypothetical protein
LSIGFFPFLSVSSGINLGVADVDTKLEGLLVNLKSALQRWHSTVFPKEKAPLSLHQLIEAFNAPVDPMLEYRATKLREGGEAIMLMVLAHGVDKEVIEKIAQAYPTGDDGKEVDVTPLVVPSRQYARRINEYMVARRQRMKSKSKGVTRASSTSTAAGARGSDK